MSKLVYCPSCGKPLHIPTEIQSDDYLVCPSCNSEFANPTRFTRKQVNSAPNYHYPLTKKQGYWLIAVIIVVVFMIIGSLSDKDKTNSGVNSNTSVGSIYYTNEGYFFATSEQVFDRMMEYMLHEDVEAMNRLTVAGLVMTLPKNTEVFLVKSGLGTVVIRPRGETVELWTTSEAIHQ